MAVWLATLLAISSVSATDDQLPLTVRMLARNLDSPELARRDAAEKSLLELGPAVLDHLPRVTARTSPEMKVRLERIRVALQRRAANEAVQPSLVTLTAKQKPIEEVLAEIEKQSGNRLVDFRARFGQVPRSKLIDLDVSEKPFWEVFDQVADAAGLAVYGYPGEANLLAYVNQTEQTLPRNGRACYVGPFRVEATEIAAMRQLRNINGGSLRLNIEIAWEPRITPISLQQSLNHIEAVGLEGETIPVEGRAGSLEAIPQRGSSAVSVNIPFVLPDRGTRRIASLTGKFTAMVPGRVEKFEFESPSDAEDALQRKGSVAVVLRRMRKNLEVYEARLSVRFDDAATALESHRGWVEDNSAYLIDGDGERIEPAAFEQTSRSANELGVAYVFPISELTDDHVLVYETPAAIIKRDFDYELKNIDLP